MRLVIGVTAYTLSYGSIAEDNGKPMESKEVELESIRSRIKDVQINIATAKGDTESFLKDIQAAEKGAKAVSGRLRELETAIQQQSQKLQLLEKQKAEREKTLVAERALLSEQIRVAYQTGNHDFLKLLLNQEDPSTVSRMLVYHSYYNRARARRIDAVKESLEEIKFLETSIRNETAEMESLRRQQIAKLDEFNNYRDSRKQLISRLEGYIVEQGKQLEVLQRNEKELAVLLDKLEEEHVAVQVYEDLTPFDKLKGKLKWPVEGTLVTHFGAERKGGRLHWNGVKIAANLGENVNAVSAGKVIFADWFRNLGLLMIVDHGDGFMSLYGNNEALLKKPGDIVSTGEVIARVGDTGGQGQTGLYFEIRQEGNPLNPGLWCRR